MNKTLKVATVYASSYGRNRLVRGEAVKPGAIDPNKITLGAVTGRGYARHTRVHLEQAKLHEVELEYPLSFPVLDAVRSVFKRAVEGHYSMLNEEKIQQVRLALNEYNVPYNDIYEVLEFLQKAEELVNQPLTVVLYWE